MDKCDMLRGQRKTRLLLLLGLLIALSFLRYALLRAVHQARAQKSTPDSKGCRILSRKFGEKATNRTRIICNQEQKFANGQKCCYTNIFGVFGDDDSFRLGDACRPMEELLVPESGMQLRGNDVPEFIRVSCGSDENVHFRPFVPFKDQVEERCNKLPKRPHQVSVLLFIIDSNSRWGAEQEFPSTMDTLRRMSAVTLKGQSVVGDDAFANLVPLLMGQAVDELDDVCGWPSPRPKRPKFDQCPHLWRSFAEQGFRTLFADLPTQAAIFNSQEGGFASPPTDYYPRPFFLAAEGTSGCVGRRTEASVLLRYVQTFVRRFASSRYLAVVRVARSAPDQALSEALKTLRRRKQLENTVLVVLTAGEIPPKGAVEEFLPLVSISFPAWFESKFPAAMTNLRKNSEDRLTTPFDLHQTLKDLAEPSRTLNAAHLSQRQAELSNLSPRGVSLFLEISDWRNCSVAHVPRRWCPCLNPKPGLID
ncbi:uncharacterized protein LOC135940512 [Cloeon dipterum]|uniref:uncharacterized protein LOC135940512 n=1 Tax=Cloeon dipterum TaxID=197152 RepID=UPI00321FDADB